MPDLKTIGLFAAGAAIALLVALLGISRVQVAETSAEYQRYKATTEEKARKASEDARTEEQRRRAEQDKVVADAKKQAQSALAAASAARTAGERLRDQLAALRGQACGNPTASPGSETAAATEGVLADVQRRLDAAADGIALHADQSRIAGLACERAYRALTP